MQMNDRPAAALTVVPRPDLNPGVATVQVTCRFVHASYNLTPKVESASVRQMVSMVLELHGRECGRCDVSLIAGLAEPFVGTLVPIEEPDTTPATQPDIPSEVVH